MGYKAILNLNGNGFEFDMVLFSTSLLSNGNNLEKLVGMYHNKERRLECAKQIPEDIISALESLK